MIVPSSAWNSASADDAWAARRSDSSRSSFCCCLRCSSSTIIITRMHNSSNTITTITIVVVFPSLSSDVAPSASLSELLSLALCLKMHGCVSSVRGHSLLPLNKKHDRQPVNKFERSSISAWVAVTETTIEPRETETAEGGSITSMAAATYATKTGGNDGSCPAIAVS